MKLSGNAEFERVLIGGKINPSNKRLFSVGEAATYLGFSPRTIYNGVAPKSKNPFPVKPKRYGKKILFDIRDLDKFCDSLSGDGGNGEGQK